MALSSLLLGVVLFQGPGDAWALVPDARQVKRLYWELFQTTEIWMRLIPGIPRESRRWCASSSRPSFPGGRRRIPSRGFRGNQRVSRHEWSSGPSPCR
jgi:hypothetical protein